MRHWAWVVIAMAHGTCSHFRCPSFLFKSCSYSVLPFFPNFNRLQKANTNVTIQSKNYLIYPIKSLCNCSLLRSHISGLWFFK